MLHDRPGYAILGRRSRGMTKELASLAGKRLGAPTTDPAVAAWPVLRTLNRIDPAAVTLENVGVAVRTPMMVSGELDGAIGLAHAIGPDLRARGVAAEDTIQLLMSDYGVELYGNALLAGPKFLAEKPLAMAGFVKAYIRGLRDVIADPAAAIESLARPNDAIRKDVDIERLQLILDQYMLTPWVKANGFGGIDPDRFSRAIDQVVAGHQLKNRPSREDVFRDDFIPPDGRQF
jgi:NitT/TauT family transport system substrate-binding protein